MANKVYADAKSALDGLTFDGMTIMSGGFGLCGIPENLILALRNQKAGDLWQLHELLHQLSAGRANQIFDVLMPQIEALIRSRFHP